MSFCESCGTKLSENERFCPNCGASVQVTYPVDLKVSGGKQVPRISATSKMPIVILIFAVISIISIICCNGTNLFDFLRYNKISLFITLYPTVVMIVFACFAIIQAKKKISMMIIPAILYYVFMIYELVIYRSDLINSPYLWRDMNLTILLFVFSLVALCLYCLTLLGLIRQKAPAAIFIGVVIALTAYRDISVIVQEIHYGVKVGLISNLYFIPMLLFFISMLIIVLSIEKQYAAGHGGNESELLKVKSIGLSIFLSIITLGIYGMVWNYSICKKIRLLNHESTECTGEWLCLEFIPYYGLYWVYTRSKKISSSAAARGISVADNSTVCLIVSIFGLGIIAFALIQNSLNEIAVSLTAPRNPSVPYMAQPQNVAYTTPSAHTANYIEEIKQLSQLHQQGILTDQEFENKKKELLSKI